MSQSIYMLNLIGKGLQWGFEVVVSAGKMLQFCSTSLGVNGAVGRLWCWASACWLEDQSKAWVPLWSITTAFCMLLNVIALWAQSHRGFCKCSRETHGFLDSRAHLKGGGKKWGKINTFLPSWNHLWTVLSGFCGSVHLWQDVWKAWKVLWWE